MNISKYLRLDLVGLVHHKHSVLKYTSKNLKYSLQEGFTSSYCVLQQAKAEFDKGEPLYITLTEVHKEAVDDGILVDKKAAEFEKQMEGLTTRHDELKKRLEDKDIE